MDLKGFVKKEKGKGRQHDVPASGNMTEGISESDISKLDGMVKGFESKSRDELIEDLKKAKQNGNINDESVAAFFSAVSGVLPKDQQEQMKKILDSLE